MRRRLLRRDRPLAEVPGVTDWDLAEFQAVAKPGWELADVLAVYPGWAERGMPDPGAASLR